MKKLTAGSIPAKHQKILDCIIIHGEMCEKDIVTATHLDDSTVGYRLMQLEASGLIKTRRVGKFLFVSIPEASEAPFNVR